MRSPTVRDTRDDIRPPIRSVLLALEVPAGLLAGMTPGDQARKRLGRPPQKEGHAMTRNEFRKRLDQLREVITRGLAYYTVWSKLRLHDKAGVSWSLEQQNKVLGRFRGFFSPVALALMDMALMQFAKAFDADSRTASLPVLLSAAQKDPSLASGKPSAELSRISMQLQENSGTLSALKQMRNQQLAHVDSNPLSVGPLMSQNIESLAEDVKSAFNWLSTAHDGNVTDWDFLLRTSGQHTTDVLNILLERSRAQAGGASRRDSANSSR